MRWLVTGSRGQLGSDLMDLLSARVGDAAVGLDLPDLDITSPSSVADAFASATPDVVVNCAAWTAVDDAEAHESAALAVNGDGPGVLAAACAASPGTVMVQVSTDYVFSGSATAPYAEDAVPDPRSAYGRTKMAGEVAVRTALPDSSYVVRTAWLYGLNGANFVRTMLRLERERETLDVVDDQRGQPTWSRDLARQLIALVDRRPPSGVFHGTNSGETTWYGLAREVFRLAGADPERVRPTTTEAFPRPAPRPAYSVLGHDAWMRASLAPMRDWRLALAEAFEAGITA